MGINVGKYRISNISIMFAGFTYMEREIFKLMGYMYCGTLPPAPRDPSTPRAPRSLLSFPIRPQIYNPNRVHIGITAKREMSDKK